MYGGIDKEYYKYEFFAKTKNFIDILWQEFNTKGYVETLIAKRRLLKCNYTNITPQKLFNYYIQAFETEYNFSLLYNIFKLLENKKSKIILYVYDSILIDFSLEDGKELYQSIKKLISTEFPIKVKQGIIYSSLKTV
jgi:DNA polymerase I-like protein with 3'-5' exonuclease and polymerase domains